MKPFLTQTGIVAPLERSNIDTDAILPKQFLKRIEKSGYGQFLFYDWRYTGDEENPDFVLNKPPYRNASILLTGENFGCGSSREHAPWALKDFGFETIIASSFADIFYNNCIKNGILPIRMSKEYIQELFKKVNGHEGYELTINLESKTIVGDSGESVSFEIDDYMRNMLLEGLDEIGSTIKHMQEIEKFEETHRVFYSIT
ncbi:3-isopropylmalate dehydratase small subunit [Planococcus versutus]|uniref:3-isopropylmalate dehydratase small subunit n=1 Tax=Planococcus versutus TaxID=1302659 RepID=A0A1B1RZF3_9BACL|nr:3-isopropylmalate dehydratase small subunit [Planococcus versutus]ANU26299.1 3-isopropylmalate dehydratase small subunit [Planococcus versutus]